MHELLCNEVNSHMRGYRGNVRENKNKRENDHEMHSIKYKEKELSRVA